jgi:GDPmannose 4,6-dehydratase
LNYRDFVVQDAQYMRPADVDILVGDPSKAKAKLGWEATTSLEDLVNVMVEAELTALH